jgi:Amt family ammonium transporter
MRRELTPALRTRAGWVVGNMLPLWYILKAAGLLRATADEEALGLDSSHHGGSAYAGTPDDDTSKHTNGVSKVRLQLTSTPLWR